MCRISIEYIFVEKEDDLEATLLKFTSTGDTGGKNGRKNVLLPV